MYHGVTEIAHEPPIWTQLPATRFREQIEFLGKHYRFLSLKEIVNAIESRSGLPDRAALITFDDGLENNYKVAFPILQKMGVPAAVFLTVDYIGSDNFLWVDELYVLLRESSVREITLDLPDMLAQRYYDEGNVWKSYEIMVELLKRSGMEKRSQEMERLEALLPPAARGPYDDFRMLGWDEVRTMQQSGLVEFGVHTATHRILTELSPEEWEREIAEPKMKLEREIGTEAASFCFPNGRPGRDFAGEHLGYLRKTGFRCAFTTENTLFDGSNGDFMQIGRVPAGNDRTSDADYFRLNTAGFVRFIKGKENCVEPGYDSGTIDR